MRVLRISHAGRERAQRDRDRALRSAGVEITLVVPGAWPGGSAEQVLSAEDFPVHEVPARRAGDVNRWTVRDAADLAALIDRVRPDLLDLHAEPFSALTHQLLAVTDLPAVAYTAQNIDKRFPPPFARRETAALQRLAGVYACSAQAASVAAGKGAAGLVRVIPLGVGPAAAAPRESDAPPRLLLVGRLEPEKGVLDAVRVAAALYAPLTLVGAGSELEPARALARELGVALTAHGWTDPAGLGRHYARSDVVLVPSRATTRWVEQFGRVVIEAQAAGVLVAAYATGSLPEIVGGAGLLAPEGDHGALADAIATTDRKALQRRGFDHAARYAWPLVAAQQADFYAAALTAGTPTAARRADRVRAIERFGRPAEVPGGGRPFALPVLRRNGPVSRAAGRLLDALG